MNFDFQLGQTALSQILEVNIERLLLPQDIGIGGVRELPFEFPGSAELGVIDHVTVSEVHLSHGSPADTIPVLLPAVSSSSLARMEPLSAAPVSVQAIIHLHMARLSDLRSAGLHPVSADRMRVLQARVTFHLAPPQGVDGTLRIAVRVVGVELGMGGLFPPAATLPEGFQRTLRELNTPESLGRFAVSPITLNTTGIARELGSDFSLWNAGIGLSSGTFTIRLQFESAAQLDPGGSVGEAWLSGWRTFYASGALSRLDGADWALFFPDRFFTRRVEASIREQLAGRTDFVLNADNMPRSTWSVRGGTAMVGGPCVPDGQAVISTLFSVSAKGQCQPWGGDIDVNCEIQAALSLPRPRTLRTDVHLDYSPDDGDMAFCTLANAAAFSHIGLFGAPFIGGGLIEGTFLGTTAGLVAGVTTLVFGYSTRPPSLGSATLHPVEGSDRDYFQETDLPVPSDPFLGRVTATGLTACSDGLAVVGTIVPPFRPVYTPGPARLVEGFRWRKTGPRCPPPPLETAFEASAKVGVGLTTPARLEILQSFPEGYSETTVHFEAEPVWGELQIRMWMDVDVARVLRDLAAAGEVEVPGFELLIQTNVGSRLIFVHGADAALSDTALEESREGARAWCEGERAIAEMIRERARFFASFMIDRPLPTLLSRSHAREWTLMIPGLAVGEVLRIGRRAPEAQPTEGPLSLAAFAPDAAGVVAVRFWERPASGAGDLAGEIRPTSDAARGCFPLIGRLAGRRTQVRSRGASCGIVGCTHFQCASEFPLDGAYRGHALAGSPNGPRLAFATTRGVWVYGVSDPRAPRLVAATVADDVRGLQASGAGFLFWGDLGAWQLDEGYAIRPVVEQAVTKVLAHRRALIVVTSEDVRVIDRLTAGGRRLAAADGRDVALAADVLLVGTGRSAEAFDLARSGAPAKPASGAGLPVRTGLTDVVVPGLVPAAKRLGPLAALVPEGEEALVELHVRVAFESS